MSRLIYIAFALLSFNCEYSLAQGPAWMEKYGPAYPGSPFIYSDEMSAVKAGFIAAIGSYPIVSISCPGFVPASTVEYDACVVTYFFSNPPYFVGNLTANSPVARCSLAPLYVYSATPNTGCYLVKTKIEDANKTCPVGKTAPLNSAVGDPIYPLTGVVTQNLLLPVAIGRTPIELIFDDRIQIPSLQGGPPWPYKPSTAFGPAWTMSLIENIMVEVGGGALSLVLSTGDGRWETFAFDSGSSTYISNVDPLNSFVATTNGWRRTDRGKLLEIDYDSTGNVTARNGAAGGTLAYEYTGQQLQQISDETGRTVQLIAGPTNAVTSIVGPDGLNIQLGYNGQGNLVSINWPDSTLPEQFLYERTDLPLLLTGVVDESGNRYSTFAYDAYGRGSSTEQAGGTLRYSVNYGTPGYWDYSEYMDDEYNVWITSYWVPPSGAVLTDPLGNANSLGAATVSGSMVQTSQSQPAGSGCAASASEKAYDASGNLASSDDFNGNRTCYAYDLTRNLRTVLLEGLPTSKACPAAPASYVPAPVDNTHPERKTTTIWHPDWALKTQEAEPKKITTWVYNGQPDPIGGGTASCAPGTALLPDGKPIAVLCARYEQATTDTTGALGLAATASGATRKWNYTYNQYGQVLTETTPKQSATDALSHTTTYVYYPTTSFSGASGYTMGDLQTVTNPLGQVTSYTSYDKAGRLLSSTDANNTVTTQTYFPRGWLHTQTVTPASGAALTTTYAYYPTGLLQTVTMPDASTLNYTYDAAHRLTDVVDGAGNKVHYVLDNLGNRTSEQVSDASGNLASTVARIYDALSRVQTTTGATH